MKKCPFCGEEVQDAAVKCKHCKEWLSNKTEPETDASSQSQQVSPVSQAIPGLKKMSVLLLILLTVITAGIYAPIWFLKRRIAINNLPTKEKLGYGVFVFAIVVLSISLVLMLTSGIIGGIGEGLNESGFEGSNFIVYEKGLEGFSKILDVVAGITLIVQCFKVRRIFTDYLQGRVLFSGAATFFFQIYYLQYKINRF